MKEAQEMMNKCLAHDKKLSKISERVAVDIDLAMDTIDDKNIYAYCEETGTSINIQVPYEFLKG